jgi:hypothetical protein
MRLTAVFMDKMIHEHDTVVILRDLLGTRFVAGDTGAIVHVYGNAPAYEVEFANPAGHPRFLVVTVDAQDVLKLQPRGRAARTVA